MAKRDGRKRARQGPEQAGTATTTAGVLRNDGRGIPCSNGGPATKQGAVADKALLVVAQSGLCWTAAAELQRTSRALCEACRRCIPARVHVGADTPRVLWARTEVPGGGGVRGGGRAVSCEGDSGTESGGGGREPRNDDGGDSAHRKGIAANSKSKTSRRRRRRQHQHQHQHHQQKRTGTTTASGFTPRLVPPLKITSLVWAAPAINLGDGSDLPAELTELTFCRDFNRPLSGIQWPPNLARLTFGSKFNRELSHKVHRRPLQPGPGFSPSASGGVYAGGGGGGGRAAHGPHHDCGHLGKTRDDSKTSDTVAADSGVGGAAVDDCGEDHHLSREHHRRSDRRHCGNDHHGKRMAYNGEPELCLLPGSLRELTLGKQFNKPLPRGALPPGLVSLTLGRNFRHHGSVRDAVWPTGLKVIRFGEAMLRRQLRDGPQLAAMRGLSSSSSSSSLSSSSDPVKPKKDFVWPAGLDRVEFWQEGRAVVSLKGGKDLDSDSVEWLDRN